MAAVLVVAVSISACSGGDEDAKRPALTIDATTRFCEILDDEFEVIGANTASADSSTVGQLQLFVQNYSETSRMLRRLAEAAPAEIKSDMTAVWEAWRSNEEAIAGVADSPIGSLASVLLTSVGSSASFDAVDAWAMRNCGRAVFSMQSAANAGASDSSADSTTDIAVSAVVPSDLGTEPTLVLCDQSTLTLYWVDANSGKILLQSAALGGFESPATIAWYSTSPDTPCPGFHSANGKSASLTVPRQLPFWSPNFDSLLGILGFEDGQELPVLIDPMRGTYSFAVDRAPDTDFNEAKPQAIAAGFVTDGSGDIAYRESNQGRCKTYRFPASAAPVSREQLSDHLLGEGGACFGTNDVHIRTTVDGRLMVCAPPFGCEDAMTTEEPANDEIIDFEGAVVMTVDVPTSDRYSLDAPFFSDRTGQVFLTGTEAGAVTLFKWAGDSSSPEAVAGLPPGRYSILGELSDPIAAASGSSGTTEAPTTSAAPATFEVTSLPVQSAYSSDYYSTVIDVVFAQPATLEVHFEAHGRTDLRQPDTSCLIGPFGRVVDPVDVDLTRDEPGNFAGTMRFELDAPGVWALRYSCTSDYGDAVLGEYRG